MLNFYLRSRMPIEEALELIYQDTKLECCLRLSESLRNGKELAKGLREIGLTDGFIYSCLSIGENTGDYPSAFDKIITYSDRRIEDRKYLTRVLSYPALLLFFTVLLLGFILFSVTPQLYKIIESTGGRFPAVLEILYALNGILTQHGRLWAILAAGLLFAVLSGLFDRGAKKTYPAHPFEKLFRADSLSRLYGTGYFLADQGADRCGYEYRLGAEDRCGKFGFAGIS